jgi:hypothetical protein
MWEVQRSLLWKVILCMLAQTEWNQENSRHYVMTLSTSVLFICKVFKLVRLFFEYKRYIYISVFYPSRNQYCWYLDKHFFITMNNRRRYMQITYLKYTYVYSNQTKCLLFYYAYRLLNLRRYYVLSSVSIKTWGLYWQPNYWKLTLLVTIHFNFHFPKSVFTRTCTESSRSSVSSPVLGHCFPTVEVPLPLNSRTILVHQPQQLLTHSELNWNVTPVVVSNNPVICYVIRNLISHLRELFCPATTLQIQSQIYIMTDGQSASLSRRTKHM